MISVTTRAVAAGSPCGLFRHLLIMIYDAVVILALLMLATAVAMLFGMENYTATEDPVYTSCLVAIWFAYLGWCWHKGGMTLGMRAWRVRIESKSGHLPGWGQCLIRFVASFVSASVAGLGFAWSLFDRERRTWHDLASRTRLVRSTNT
jgi:uncharacterized RDD family membrane protein YckC